MLPHLLGLTGQSEIPKFAQAWTCFKDNLRKGDATKTQPILDLKTNILAVGI